MTRILFTADLHLGTTAALRHFRRPFASASDMDEALILNWNAAVRPEDNVFILGNVVNRSAKPVESYLERLNGRKHLVWGRHDNNKVRGSHLWTSSQPVGEFVCDGRLYVLNHHPQRFWSKMTRGAIHLHGAMHGKLTGFRLPGARNFGDQGSLPDNLPGGCLDVGTDCWNFRPVSLTDLLAKLRTLPEMSKADFAIIPPEL